MPKDKNNKQETIKLTADSLIKDAMCLEPAAALKLVVQELGAKSGKDLLASHLKQLVPLIAKNGWYKAKDLGKSVAGFGKKNKEDSTGIDFANADIDMSTMKTRRVADGKCVAELEKLAAVFQKEASACVKEAEAASKKLEADCKSSDVELSREEMSDHAIEVAAVVDSKESKGKKGKELTKDIKSKIDTSKKAAKLAKTARRIKASSKRIKSNSSSVKKSASKIAPAKKNKSKPVKKLDEGFSVSVNGENVSFTDGGASSSALKALRNAFLMQSDSKTRKLLKAMTLSCKDKMLNSSADGSSIEKALSNIETFTKRRDRMWELLHSIPRSDLDNMTPQQQDLYKSVVHYCSQYDTAIDNCSKAAIAASDAFDATNDLSDAVSSRIPDAADNGKDVAQLAKQNGSEGLWNKISGGVSKALKAFGVATAVAKIAKFGLNHGKEIVDALGAQAVKFKEDKDIIAQISVLVSNGDKSDSAYSDTRFGIRFSLGDMKWHAVNLDDRKMQISGEDDLIKRVLDTKEAKNFKKKCLDAWDKLFKGGKSPIIYILQNYKKLSIKIDDKAVQKLMPILAKMAKDYSGIEEAFK